ncbi:MAG: hypothetical protein V4673_04705 [Pseudomonadota bacterium]
MVGCAALTPPYAACGFFIIDGFFRRMGGAMRFAIFLVAVLLPFSAIAADRGGFSVIGEWEWNPLDGVCPERFTYRADGMVMMQSGEERLVKTYVLTRVSNDVYRLSSTVKATNGKPDCRGDLSPVGTKSSAFVMPTKGRAFLTCTSMDKATCFGTAKAVKRKK